MNRIRGVTHLDAIDEDLDGSAVEGLLDDFEIDEFFEAWESPPPRPDFYAEEPAEDLSDLRRLTRVGERRRFAH